MLARGIVPFRFCGAGALAGGVALAFCAAISSRTLFCRARGGGGGGACCWWWCCCCAGAGAGADGGGGGGTLPRLAALIAFAFAFAFVVDPLVAAPAFAFSLTFARACLIATRVALTSSIVFDVPLTLYMRAFPSFLRTVKVMSASSADTSALSAFVSMPTSSKSSGDPSKASWLLSVSFSENLSKPTCSCAGLVG